MLLLIVLLNVLVINVYGNINSLKYVYQNDIYKKLFLSLSSMSVYLDSRNDNDLVFFCPGYMIPIECYTNLYDVIQSSIPQSSETIVYNSNNIDNNDSILTDINNLKNLLSSKTDKQNRNIIIFGHSRGGSVALSSLLSANLKKDINKLLILLDPVDDGFNNAIKILKEYRIVDDNLKILLIKLPYGGYSKFYKKSFDSSCAPNGRNADTFMNIFEEYHYNVDYKIIQEFGHFGLLSEKELEKLAIGNVCSFYDNTLSPNIIQSKKNSAYNIITQFIKLNVV